MNKKNFNKKSSLQLVPVQVESKNNQYICEEFCYSSNSKPLQVSIFPSKIFETENIDYILSGIKKAEKLTNK